ncbi:rod shape-determining protein MreC [Enterobacter cancerogenus]|uniref:Rod shape-determining protein MreC n=1 Tax=Enterobacter cancerogenus TaxID=69218 RepID=A0A484WGS7_9ENTR|nr:rod shape-determining protein MreC [Enterobacter cancerogenus]
MKPIFSPWPIATVSPYPGVLVALGVIIADSRLGTFSQIRTYMDTAVSPFYFISNGPRELLDSVRKRCLRVTNSNSKTGRYVRNCC